MISSARQQKTANYQRVTDDAGVANWSHIDIRNPDKLHQARPHLFVLGLAARRVNKMSANGLLGAVGA